MFIVFGGRCTLRGVLPLPTPCCHSLLQDVRVIGNRPFSRQHTFYFTVRADSFPLSVFYVCVRERVFECVFMCVLVNVDGWVTEGGRSFFGSSKHVIVTCCHLLLQDVRVIGNRPFSRQHTFYFTVRADSFPLISHYFLLPTTREYSNRNNTRRHLILNRFHCHIFQNQVGVFDCQVCS